MNKHISPNAELFIQMEMIISPALCCFQEHKEAKSSKVVSSLSGGAHHLVSINTNLNDSIERISLLQCKFTQISTIFIETLSPVHSNKVWSF